MKRKILALTLAGLMCFSLSACGQSQSTGGGDTTAEQVSKVSDLTGEWKQVNSAADDSYQAATVTADTIEIYWVNEADDSKSLYWAGTYVAPTTDDEPYTWDSVNDKTKTDTALLASGDDTKTFTYKDGQISYEASALGTTTTIKLEKQ